MKKRMTGLLLMLTLALTAAPAHAQGSSYADAFSDWFNSTRKPTSTPTAAPAATPVPSGANSQIAEAPEAGSLLIALYDTEIRLGPGSGYQLAGILSAGGTVEYTGIQLADQQGVIWYAIAFGENGVWVSSQAVSVIAPEMVKPTETVKPIETVRPTETVKPTETVRPMETAAPTAAPEIVEMAENSIGRYTGGYAVEASSYRSGNNPAVYGSCALDSDLISAWNTHDSIAGEWLKISVKDGRSYQIAGLRIANGYWKNSDVYSENSKVKSFDIYCDGQYVTTAQLENIKSFQTIWFDQPVTGSSLKIVIQSGYSGSRYRDCCITEIELLGPGGQELAPELLGDWGGSVRTAEAKARSGSIEKGDRGMAVVGLQLLLRDGFGVLEGSVDGAFGNGTKAAVQALAGQMQNALPDCLPMKDGAVDAAYWRNMLEYMKTLR